VNPSRSVVDEEEETRRFREDAAIVLGQRVDQMVDISKGLLDVTDTGPAEAMWLASRRTRAALDMFKPVLSKDQFPGTRDEIKRLTRSVGRRRDVDSMITAFEEIGAEMDEEGEYGLSRVVESLRSEQADCNRTLSSLTNGRRLQALRVRVEDLSGRSLDGEGDARTPAYRSPEQIPGSARRLVAKRLKRLRSSVPEALEPSAVHQQQRMRVSAERLRYLLELTAEALGTQAHTARRAARGLQEILGEMRDCDLALPAVRDQLAVFEQEDTKAIVERARGSRDLDPLLVQAAPNRNLYRGPHLAAVHLQARRQMLFERFRRLWLEQSRQGVWVALESSLGD
jgi:CHAD domain-containing protein